MRKITKLKIKRELKLIGLACLFVFAFCAVISAIVMFVGMLLS